MIKENDYVLLLSKERNFLVKVKKDKKINTDFGIIEIKDIINKKFQDKIKTHKGKEFFIVKPTIIDFLNKKVKILPQAVRPKDTALILAFTGINKDSVVVEAGTGSAWITLFLANYVKKIYSYEIREDFYKNAKNNIEESKFKNIILKNKNIIDGIEEKNVDAVILDMKNAEKVIEHSFNSLKHGGWLIVFSPYIEQVKDVVNEIKKFDFTQLTIVENILRPWDIREHSLPKRKGLLHTGFLTFARKV